MHFAKYKIDEGHFALFSNCLFQLTLRREPSKLNQNQENTVLPNADLASHPEYKLFTGHLKFIYSLYISDEQPASLIPYILTVEDGLSHCLLCRTLYCAEQCVPR